MSKFRRLRIFSILFLLLTLQFLLNEKLFIGGSSQVQSLESPVKEAMPRDGPQEHLESEIAKMD